MSAYGVLGGTFDPVHVGHVHAAQCVRRTFDLAEVLLVPSAVPPHKSRPGMAAAQHRLEMATLAAEGKSWLSVSRIELDRGGVSYTIDTMEELQTRRPRDHALFVLGVDAFLELRTWREPEALVRSFDLVVVDRPGSALPAGAPDPELASLLLPVPFAAGAGRPRRGRPRGAAPRAGPDLPTGDPPRGRLLEPGEAARRGGCPAARSCPSRGRPLYSRARAVCDGGTPLSDLTAHLATCLEAATDKKAEDVVILDLRGLSDVTDAFVICHGSTERQTTAIADAIEQRLREAHGRRPGHVEGKRSGEWILMDYLDFVVHVFTPETRSYYGLERLWGDAPRLAPAATERRATRRSPSATA